jgi:ATP-dependent protease HslVU (ClpYQ) peptidase subunit
MTLIVVIPSSEGSVMASDGQVTIGPVKTRAKKIEKLNDDCVWGAAGDIALIQMVEGRIGELPNKGRHLQELRKDLCEIVPQCVRDLPPSPEPYFGAFIFAERKGVTRILIVYANGVSVMLEDVPFAIGSGELFAFALLQKYQDLIPAGIGNNKLAAVLAYKTIAETIEVVSGGIGPPIDVWQLPPAKNLTKEELTHLEDTYLGLKEAEIKMFLGSGS